MAVSVPYVLRIEQPRDLLRFERDLRTLLQCESPACAFLHSAGYAAVKFRAQHALCGRSEEGGCSAQTLRIPDSVLLLHVSDDGLTLIVNADPLLILYPENNKKGEEEGGTLKRGRALCCDPPQGGVNGEKKRKTPRPAPLALETELPKRRRMRNSTPQSPPAERK